MKLAWGQGGMRRKHKTIKEKRQYDPLPFYPHYARWGKEEEKTMNNARRKEESLLLHPRNINMSMILETIAHHPPTRQELSVTYEPSRTSYTSYSDNILPVFLSTNLRLFPFANNLYPKYSPFSSQSSPPASSSGIIRRVIQIHYLIYPSLIRQGLIIPRIYRQNQWTTPNIYKQYLYGFYMVFLWLMYK